MASALEAGLVLGSVLLVLSACSPASPRVEEWHRERTQAANNGFSDWSNVSNNMMVEKYGPPDRVETLGLVWFNRGPWKKIEVWDELGFVHEDRASRNIEETIAYAVPSAKRDALVEFDKGLHVSPDGVELSARSASEGRNFLMLNLADEIVRGLLSPSDARAEYLRTLQLADAGKTSPSMQGLLFPRGTPPELPNE